jgi:predicted metal-dependent phosphoesterase TrpH
MSQIDLHVHSTASDGRFSPEEVVRHAAELGLTVMSLTDHDTVDGVGPALAAARRFPRLRVVPGVEVSTDVPHGEVHILGYFIDYASPGLATTLARFRASREGRAQAMVARLAQLGVHIGWPRVKEIAGSGSIARPHIAQAMLEKGYIGSIREAFDRYISRDGPAYVEREKMTPAEAVTVILHNGGLPVMAHPLTAPEPEKMIQELKGAGMVGLEAYYNSYSAEKIEYLTGLARRHGLIATGGSDYHGLDDSNETVMGGVDVPVSSAERLFALAEQRALKVG